MGSVSCSCLLWSSLFFFTIVDDLSCGVQFYLMKEKSEVAHLLRSFIALVQTQFNKQVKVVRIDNAIEFKSRLMKVFYQEKGITHQTSCVDTPQQNGQVEWKHRHILNMAQTLHFQASLPLDFWGECALTSAYLINRTPSILLGGKTPYEIIYQIKPTYDHIKAFCSLCYAQSQIKGGDKFASRSRHCIFMGYPYGKKLGSCMIQKHKNFLRAEMLYSMKNFSLLRRSS